MRNVAYGASSICASIGRPAPHEPSTTRAKASATPPAWVRRADLACRGRNAELLLQHPGRALRRLPERRWAACASASGPVAAVSVSVTISPAARSPAGSASGRRRGVSWLPSGG
eukprot:scaffold1340_cov253-Pinguiococcus_pyrenoidosus.AAC.26